MITELYKNTKKKIDILPRAQMMKCVIRPLSALVIPLHRDGVIHLVVKPIDYYIYIYIYVEKNKNEKTYLGPNDTSFGPTACCRSLHDDGVRALTEWQKYLHGSTTPFEIHSDHKNLQYFI